MYEFDDETPERCPPMNHELCELFAPEEPPMPKALPRAQRYGAMSRKHSDKKSLLSGMARPAKPPGRVS